MPNALRGVGVALTCLQLLLLLSAADSRPHTWDQDRFQLETIKKGILERLGMPAPPVIRRQLDQESIQRAQRLYQQKVAELARNRSQEAEEEEAVSRTRRLHRLTPTCKWPWLGVTPRPSSPRDARVSQRVPHSGMSPRCLGTRPGMQHGGHAHPYPEPSFALEVRRSHHWRRFA